jgi:hypothetical protein
MFDGARNSAAAQKGLRRAKAAPFPRPGGGKGEALSAFFANVIR